MKALQPALIAVEPHSGAIGLRVQRAMHRNQLPADRGLERQTGKKIQVVSSEATLRPGHRTGRGAAESFGRNPPADRKIVIAGDAKRIMPPNGGDALGRLGVVSDNVTETDDAIDAGKRNVIKHRLQSR